ncbi:MFS transporter [Frigoriglobus tundricola]|uniref:Putative MFS-type transporter n=1 Tax=Frigoriglobus tundricola TaxID=2774151 RepID=A0A6M5YX00_9BACT|nr:MFS transporter [Frigoriglobus tundricola]QJW98525.1 putative MFS-type transporter [Frigoriglobus tundricola]
MSIAGKLTRDGWLLFATRCSRMFAYGLLSVVLVLYLVEVGLKEWEVGLLLSLTLAGDTVISLWLTTTADRFGRRRTLVVGAVLMALAGIVFVSTDSFVLLLIAATIGVISPSGNEIGPFLSVEQAALSHIVSDERRTDVFAWYNLVGSFSTALGALAGGLIAAEAQHRGLVGAAAFRLVLLTYAGIGVALIGGFVWVSSAVEVTRDESRPAPKVVLGLHESRRTVFKLSLLFALDALGGGFVIQSRIAYWFYLTYKLDPALIGTIFLFANVLAGVSALAAGWLARRIGLLNTMIFTHLPSNVQLVLVPLMPDVYWAVCVLLARFSISQMDAPTRQAYTMAVVRPDERSAAAGVTGVARSVGASISPVVATILVGSAGWASVPFFLAGGLKIVYDVLLYRAFSGSGGTKDAEPGAIGSGGRSS